MPVIAEDNVPEVEVVELSIEEKIRLAFPEEPNTMVAIARCESLLKADAYNPYNRNGTVDRGVFQINSVHDQRLAELGLDVWDEDDNITFARMLYDERNKKPWVCWTKNLI